MKILAVYTTKTGTAEKCLCELQKYLPQGEFTLENITHEKSRHNIEDFDLVLVGSSVRMGKVHKKIKDYITENADKLKKVNYALFLCLGFADLFDEYVNKNFDRDFIDNAKAISCFGGEMDLSKQKGIDKFIVKLVRNDILRGGPNGGEREDMTLPTISDSNISQLAEIVKNITSSAK